MVYYRWPFKQIIEGLMATITPFYRSANKDFTLVNGDCVSVLEAFDFKFDMIFADPPYFLSNGGISVSSGKVVCVDKGEWDKAPSAEYIDEFNRRWLSACKDKLKDNGTIWISGTHHNIFSVADQLSELGFKILNVVTWNKTDPPDNVSHRVFKHSAEYIIWAKKSKRAQHRYIRIDAPIERWQTDDGCVAYAGSGEMGEVMWQASCSETIELIVTHCHGFYKGRRLGSRPL